MDDDKSNMYTFAQMTTLEKHSFLELCMSQGDIPWKKLLAKFFSEFEDEDYLSYMIQKYKDTLNEQSMFDTPHKKARVGSIPVSNEIRSRRGSPGGSPMVRRNFRYEDADQEIQELEEKLRVMKAKAKLPWGNTGEDVHVLPARRSNVNTGRGNIVVNVTETHRLVDLGHKTWINSKVSNTMFDNPGKIFRTLMNYYDVPVTTDEVTSIPHIRELDRIAPLVNSFVAACKKRNIILRPRDKSFPQVFSCDDADPSPILIVAKATKHTRENDDDDDTEMPYYNQIIVLMLLIQGVPHVIIPGNKANLNLHLGTMIRTKDYGKNTSFEKYMQVNVNEKLVPIPKSNSSTRGPERKLKFISYFTTAYAAARSKSRSYY